ncbi:ABC transporter substrate-binding protein [uncultured Pseudodesulfovibrio sp.]|uniref:ABC transporter substrate-binding protein n=1 Tax=uncultured Pseudodesulfovibrio sp. TaxID=2035858 RepID=UPI0029C870D0|nr:ABC transporter substrate-binding protein [uncultured Pseudodesulfovibrio sp.]
MNARSTIKGLVLLLVCVATLFPFPAEAGRPLVVFANPAAQGDVFFQPLTDFMQAAADDLGFELETYYGNRNHVIIDDNVQAIFKRDPLPDYVIAMNARGSGMTLLEKAKETGVKVAFINQGFLGEQRDLVGLPGEKYPNWLFEFLPDDTHAGWLLASTLIKTAKTGNMGSKIQITAISGHESSAASTLRERGLKKALAEHPSATLNQTVHAGWKREQARKLAGALLKRYPETDILWSASDLMALGICDAVRAAHATPGKDILIGGVDWADFALDMVEEGAFTATVGGHFMDGGWALVMLYDHIHGIRIPATSTSHFSVITADNVEQYRRHFGTNRWGEIDFRRFSRHLNPQLKQYDFGLEAVLRQLQ